VIVTDIDAAGPARLSEIRVNQVILEINRQKIESVEDYEAVVSGLPRGRAAALLVYDRASRQRVISTVVLDPDT
jgi:S1-C subfamily serine protease